MQATQFRYKKHLITIAPTTMPLELGESIDGYYLVIIDPGGNPLDIASDCFLTERTDAIAHTKKIVDSIT